MWKISTFVVMLIVVTLPSQAQVDPKRSKCLSEAEQKGLYSSYHGKGSEAANNSMAPQRSAFMKECMSRR